MARGGVLLAAAISGSSCTGPGSQISSRVDWPTYRGDPAGTGYSSLAQITAENVGGLTELWSFSLRTPEDAPSGDGPDPSSQATPIVVGDVMYLPTADGVVALDPTSGAELWRSPVSSAGLSRRGVAYWPGDEAAGPRVVFTAGTRLLAIDADDGSPAIAFGQAGEVDIGVPYNSVPLVFENVIVVGANTPRGAIGGIGNARAFDARSGDKLWEFASVPAPGEAGRETWAGDSAEGRLGVNAWPFYFTVDEERGLLYLPLASPIPGAYGGDREGANLFGNSVVAVDIRTGRYAWHFQTIHHDLWDADPPAPPVLFDVTSGGVVVPALAVSTKSGYLYVLNRETGEPVFGVEERPVPASDVPGERTFATQPIPMKPPPLARVSYEASDLVTADDTSAEHAEACAALVASVGEIYNAGPFTPWVYRAPGGAARTSLVFPGLLGGPNWGGVAFDPNTSLLIAFSQDVGALGWIEEAPASFPVPYDRRGPRPSTFDVPMGEQRWPCQKPPWGRLTAVDATTGDVVWQEAVGITEGLPPERQGTGRPGRAAAIVTGGGVVFMASTDDRRFRAFDVESGRELWATRLDRQGNADPMTYLGSDGRQYVAVVDGDEVIAFGLP